MSSKENKVFDEKKYLQLFPLEIRELPILTFLEQPSFRLMDLPLDSYGQYDLSYIEETDEKIKEYIQLSSMLCVIIGHPQATISELQQAAKALKIDELLLIQAAVITKKTEVFLDLINDSQPHSGDTMSRINLVQSITAFGTSEMLECYISKLPTIIDDTAFQELKTVNDLVNIIDKQYSQEESCVYNLFLQPAVSSGNNQMLNYLLEKEVIKESEVCDELKRQKYDCYYNTAKFGKLEALKGFRKILEKNLTEIELADLDHSCFNYAYNLGFASIAQYLFKLLPDDYQALLTRQREDFNSQLATNSNPNCIEFGGLLDFWSCLELIRMQISMGNTQSIKKILQNDAIAHALIFDYEEKESDYESISLKTLCQRANAVELLPVIASRAQELEQKSKQSPFETQGLFAPKIRGPFLQKIDDSENSYRP